VRRAVAVAAVVAVAVVVFAATSRSHAPARALAKAAATTAAVRLPPAPKAAFAVGPAVGLAKQAGETEWVSVRQDTIARRSPSASAAAAGRLAALTPEDTTNIVLPLARRRDAAGGLWVRVRLPALPNGTTGWVPRAALGAYGSVTTHLVVDLAAQRATLWRDGRVALRVPVGVGTAKAPTPRGEFVIRNRLTRFHSAVYGPVALGTSARSATLTDWPGGGYIGIHGTNEPGRIPGRVSHGCIRLRNADILRLARLAPVGTPLTIR